MQFTQANAREFLTLAGVFHGTSEWDDDPKWDQTLNLNDAFYYACSDGEYVEDEELPRLAELFWRYGNIGLEYWVLEEKRGGEVPEFLDVRRQIEFVKNEEAIRKEVPSSAKRAYLQREYTIGKAVSSDSKTQNTAS